MFGNFEARFWAFASMALGGAVIIGILRNPAGITEGAKAAAGFIVDTTSPFLKA